MLDSRRMKELLENISSFLELKVELIKVELQEDLAELGSRLILLFAMLIFIFLALLAATIGLSQYLNTVLVSSYMGYVIITSFYLFLVLLTVILNKYFKLDQGLKLYILKILEKKDR